MSDLEASTERIKNSKPQVSAVAHSIAGNHTHSDLLVSHMTNRCNRAAARAQQVCNFHAQLEVVHGNWKLGLIHTLGNAVHVPPEITPCVMASIRLCGPQ